MTLIGQVLNCARYPVKSLRGEELARLELDDRGVVGDRWWALRTPQGRFGSGKTTRRFVRMRRLLEMSAALRGGVEPVLTLPDGRELKASDPEISAALSEVVGREVTLAAEDRISHLDAGPVHLITTASLHWWAAQLGAADRVAWQRARPNLVVDTGPGAGRPEDDWIGRSLRIGSTVLEVTGRVERCVMVGHAQQPLPAAPALLRTLAGHDLTLGVYARVVQAGTLEVGYPVHAS